MTPFVFVFSFIMLVTAIAPGYVVIYGQSMSFAALKTLSRVMLFLFLASIFSSILFSLSYLNLIQSKGYLHCKGIPSGWMPGMATQYATSEALCVKKQP